MTPAEMAAALRAAGWVCFSSADIARFWGKAVPTPAGCWEWTSDRNNKGYGRISMGGRPLKAHRVAYQIINGSIPPGKMVLHSCDNRGCVNPTHLRVGTAKDNVDDMIRRNRKASSAGEANPKSKLTTRDVVSIRNDKRGQKAIAAEYGINPKQVWRVRTGAAWK